MECCIALSKNLGDAALFSVSFCCKGGTEGVIGEKEEGWLFPAEGGSGDRVLAIEDDDGYKEGLGCIVCVRSLLLSSPLLSPLLSPLPSPSSSVQLELPLLRLRLFGASMERMSELGADD
jgi:hypothetical protein